MIPVVITEQTGVDRKDDLLLGGVPVVRGALKQGGWFSLTNRQGRSFDLEGKPAAYWPDGSIKWLHLCGLADIEGGADNYFTLTPRPLRPAGLLVQADAQRVRIRGGVIDVDVAADQDNLLSASRPGRKPQALLKAPGLSACLTYVGPDGGNPRRHKLSLADAVPEVVVATANRVVVRLGGRFLGRHGRCVSELILFIEVFRQSPEIRIEPVWIYLGDSRKDLVESLTVTAHVPLNSRTCAYTFSDERGQGFRDVIRRMDPAAVHPPRWPVARQLQLGSGYYRTEKRTFRDNAGWLKAMEGGRSQGWCHVEDGRLGVTAAMRYFWQEYPHSLEIDCDAGTLEFGLVPSGAKPLDLRRYSPIVGSKYEYGRGPSQYKTHEARGVAKAHELMLRFGAAGEAPAEIAARGLFFSSPARPMVTPSYLAASKVLGYVAAADSPRDKRVQRTIKQIMDFAYAEREYRKWYGLVDFGDAVSDFVSDEDRWDYDNGGHAWVNTESLPDYGFWVTALRCSRADWLEYAVTMSRHNRDLDTYHRGPLAGLGTRHNTNHWGCMDKEWRVSMPLVRRLHYYTTADPWTAEYIRETVEAVRSYNRETCTAPSMSCAAAGIFTLWEMTNDPRDEAALRNFASAFAACVLPDGQFATRMHADLTTGLGRPADREPFTATFFMNTFGGQHTLVQMAELLDHKALKDALVRHVDFYIDGDLRRRQAAKTEKDPEKLRLLHRTMFHASLSPFAALAYRYTGSPKYQRAIRESLRRVHFRLTEIGGDGALDTPRHDIMPGYRRQNKVMCHGIGDQLHCPPYGLAAL